MGDSDTQALPNADDPPGSDGPGTLAVTQAVHAYLQRRPEISGLGVAIVDREHGVRYRRAFGDFDLDSRVLLASVGKLFSVSAILSLVERDGFDLDRPIAQYADWGERKPRVTMRHILTMQAGVPGVFERWAPYDCMFDPEDRLSRCGAAIFASDDAAVSFPPGTRFRYGGGAWQMAGAVAQVVAGRSWAELFWERVAEPCGLEDSGFVNVIDEARFWGMHPVHGELEMHQSTANPNIEGGAFATVDDLAKVLRMHLRGGWCGDRRVLSAGLIAQSQFVPEVRVDELPPGVAGYGFGWWAYAGVPGGVRFNTGAFGSAMWIDPELGYGVVMLARAGIGEALGFEEELYGVVRASVARGSFASSADGVFEALVSRKRD